MKNTLLTTTLLCGLLSSSCLGPNNAADGLRNWNAKVSDQDWLNELIFVGLWVIPVYPIAWLGDILVFNTIGYWSGENPIQDAGPFPDSFGRD